MHMACWNRNWGVLKLLLEAKLVDDDLLKIGDNEVRRLPEICNTWSTTISSTVTLTDEVKS